ncbi:SDR family NAD(P)-dependent oxidoreductase [Limimaricola litoreus]|uniref:Glucose 1-dehydrogenase n=1 Tax=Limimaricola litoreus TaxID=2955316 RepID=A0A9X2FVG6_9RHOB|nr:glucose 1-dehydrogenase [Limimaricola litoreus]MCP1168368.1 glucose 1-dehydrogenase [Limimaricola litoreus]
MSGRLQDRVAIVTGAESGIGQACATAFAREGADLVLGFLDDADGAETTARSVREAGRAAVTVQCDHTRPEDVERLFAAAQDAFGPPDILLNSAGLDAPGEEVAEMSDETWDKMLKVDLFGPFLCCRAFIRARRAAGGGGRIVNISSVHEEIPRIGSAAYDAAKGGLRNLTRTLCLELAPDRIAVNNIAPGMIMTAMNAEAQEDPEARERQVRNIPWRRAGQPEEVAHLAVYLASPEADYVTGQTFTIDGGLSLNVGQGA